MCLDSSQRHLGSKDFERQMILGQNVHNCSKTDVKENRGNMKREKKCVAHNA